MRWLAIALQVLLGLMFLFSAALKLTGGAEDMRLHLGIAPWFWAITAMVETIGVVGMLAGIKYARLAILAGLWLGATMFGGIISHALAGDSPIDALPAIVLLVLSLAVATLNSRAAQVGDPSNAPAGRTPAHRSAAS